MNLDLGAALEETVDRLTTPVAGLVVVLFAIAGILQQAGLQDLVFAWMQSWADTLAETDPQAAAQMEQQLESAAGQSLGFSLGTGPAVALLLVGFVASMAVLVLAIDAFARGVDSTDGFGTDRLGWKTANLTVGWLLWAFVTFGFSWLLGLGLVFGVLTMFFPVAVAVEGKWFGAAYAASIGFVTDNIAASLVLAVLAVVLYIVQGVVASVVGAVPPAALGGSLAQIVSAAAWTLLWATLAVSYAQGSDGSVGNASVDGAGQRGHAA